MLEFQPDDKLHNGSFIGKEGVHNGKVWRIAQTSAAFDIIIGAGG